MGQTDMSKQEYHSRPIVIEAMQWDAIEQSKELIEWGKGKISHTSIGKTSLTGTDHWGLLVIETSRGKQMGMPYDWLIRDITGNFSFMDTETFNATYIVFTGASY
jgi:hypothetical protein